MLLLAPWKLFGSHKDHKQIYKGSPIFLSQVLSTYEDHVASFQTCLISCSSSSTDADTKLMTLYWRSDHVDVIFDFMSTILLHDCFIIQACKSHFIVDLENIQICFWQLILWANLPKNLKLLAVIPSLLYKFACLTLRDYWI